MKLYEAIKEIVKLKGKNIITDSALLNYLNDYHAFEERPASKLVLRDVINGGYSDKILQLNNTESSWTIKLKSYEHDFVDSCGYKEELVDYVFNNITKALGIADYTLLQDFFDADNTTSKHLTFKHIEIDGKAQKFIGRLSENGFKIAHNYNNENRGAILRGTFAGIKDCRIIVSGTAKSQIVWSVSVDFCFSNNWDFLKNFYFQYKNKLEMKYGIPKQCYEDFFTVLWPDCYEGDGHEIKDISTMSASYTSYFETIGGTVALWIYSTKLEKNGYLRLQYIDAINSEVAKKEDKETQLTEAEKEDL